MSKRDYPNPLDFVESGLAACWSNALDLRHVAVSLRQLKNDGNAVMAFLGDGAFQGLDKLKQTGFYTGVSGYEFAAPRDVVTVPQAQAVYQLAWRAETTLDFVLKGGNLRRCMDQARNPCQDDGV